MSTTPNDFQPPDDKAPLTPGVENINQNTTKGWTYDDNVEKVADQVQLLYQKKGRRYDTYFYKVVLGGNVKIAGQVIDCIRDRGGSETLQWLLDTGRKRRTFHAPIKRKSILRATQIIMFLFLAVISIILSPVFYAIHGITASIFTQRKRRLAANIKLPLAYAAFSQNDDMLRLFLSKGVDIEDTDNQGNNVFHYIADISAESPDRAIEIFKSTVKFINDAGVVRQLLGKRRNSASLTAIEYTSKYGSPALLTQMLNHPNLLQHTAIAVSKEDIVFGNPIDNKRADEYETKLEYVDVSMYEAGSITKQSAILNFLSDREVTEMSLPDLELFDKYAFVGKWMALKTKQMFLGISISHAVDVIITIFIVCLIYYGYSAVPLSNKWQDLEMQAEITEIQAQGRNQSHILKPDSYNRILKKVQYDHQLQFFQEQNFDEQKLQLLLKNTFLTDDSILDEYHNDISNMDISGNLSHPVLDLLFDTAISMEEFDTSMDGLIFWRHLPFVIQQYAAALLAKHEHLLKTKITVATRGSLTDEIAAFFENYTIEDIQPSKSVTFDEFGLVICMSPSYFTVSDIMLPKDAMHPREDWYDSTCDFKAASDLMNKACNGSEEEVYKQIADLFAFYRYGYWAIIEKLITLVAVLAILYLLLDLAERLVYIYSCISSHTHANDMISSVLSKKVPGPYTRKQLNILTFCAFLLHYTCEQLAPYIAPKIGVSEDEYHTYLVYFQITGMIFRFVMHIHGLRLLPGIGHFVITTFSMGNNLIHFSAIYTIVLFIFAVIFHILVDDPNCPLKKYAGFEDILASMFATFKLTFGHGDFNPYYTTTPVKLTYTIFVIISGLLLMNLIIAIMSTTATDIMADPYKSTLWRTEWLDEALSIEYTFSILTLPFSKWSHCGYWSHKRAGYDVRQDDGKSGHGYKVFIEVFHCPALK